MLRDEGAEDWRMHVEAGLPEEYVELGGEGCEEFTEELTGLVVKNRDSDAAEIAKAGEEKEKDVEDTESDKNEVGNGKNSPSAIMPTFKCLTMEQLEAMT